MSLTTGRDFIEPCIILSVQSHVYNYRVFAKFFSVAETWENVLTGHADVKEVGIIFMLNESPGVGGCTQRSPPRSPTPFPFMYLF